MKTAQLSTLSPVTLSQVTQGPEINRLEQLIQEGQEGPYDNLFGGCGAKPTPQHTRFPKEPWF